MPLDAERGVEAGAIVFPGADGGHLNDDICLEILAQANDQRFINRWWCRRRTLGVFERNPLRIAEVRTLAPVSVDNCADLSVADAVVAAPGSVEVLSEWAANDCANTEVEQVAQSGWRLSGSSQPA